MVKRSFDSRSAQLRCQAVNVWSSLTAWFTIPNLSKSVDTMLGGPREKNEHCTAVDINLRSLRIAVAMSQMFKAM